MTISFSGNERGTYLSDMQREEYDVFVIGGGITGAGIALDAVTRGMKTALVDMQDFAAGTSSRSTKLVHGGLRYLKQFEIKMVAEVGKERAVVYENGPHVTSPEWMLLPIYKGGTFGKFSTSLGLRVYDFLAGVKRSERRKMLNAVQTLQKEPSLKKKGLQGGGYYVEYRTDDARLTIEVVKKAIENGVNAVNYTKVEAFIYEGKKTVGVVLKDQLNGETYEVRAKKIINAAGPWVDTLRDKDQSKRGKTLHLTKGVHLVFDHHRFPLQQAIYFDATDGRMVFAIPRGKSTYVGTTDTHYNAADCTHPQMTNSDLNYLLNAINFMFPSLNITTKDIESSWTGLRPLLHEEGKNPSEISRRDEVFISHSGLITIAGGKLTGYRKMAENVVNLITRQLTEEGHGAYASCQTKQLPISGGEVGGSINFSSFLSGKIKEGVALGLSEAKAKALVQRYGSNIDEIYAFIQTHDQSAHALPLDIEATVHYSIHKEMVCKPIDFFIRRTGALFFDIAWVHNWKEPILALMAKSLNWTEAEKKCHTEELQQHLVDAVTPINAAD